MRPRKETKAVISWLRKIIKHRGIKNKDLAEYLNIRASTLSADLRPTTCSLRVHELMQICMGLDIESLPVKDMLTHAGVHWNTKFQDEPEPVTEDQMSLGEFVDAQKKRFVQERLRQHNGNRTRTAKSMGISRQQVINLINQYNIK